MVPWYCKSKAMKKIYSLLLLAFTLPFFSGCELEEEPPTKSSMEGVWEMTEAYDASGTSIGEKLKFPIVGFHLSSDNTMISTAGPMFMHIVYGDNKYTSIASKVDQVFNYAGLDFNGGEFFVAGGVVDRFTVEMKLEGLPGQKALTDLLDIIGIGQDYLDMVIYHKFKNVKVTFSDDGESDEGKRAIMTWEFDEQTTAHYNTKNSEGEYVLWQGWPVDKFSKGRFVFKKTVKDLKTVVQDAL